MTLTGHHFYLITKVCWNLGTSQSNRFCGVSNIFPHVTGEVIYHLQVKTCCSDCRAAQTHLQTHTLSLSQAVSSWNSSAVDVQQCFGSYFNQCMAKPSCWISYCPDQRQCPMQMSFPQIRLHWGCCAWHQLCSASTPGAGTVNGVQLGMEQDQPSPHSTLTVQTLRTANALWYFPGLRDDKRTAICG